MTVEDLHDNQVRNMHPSLQILISIEKNITIALKKRKIITMIFHMSNGHISDTIRSEKWLMKATMSLTMAIVAAPENSDAVITEAVAPVTGKWGTGA